MRHAKLALLLILILALTGCGDDDYNGDDPGGGDYPTYWGVTEVFSTEGYIPEMTQKPESPSPPSDQEDCPSIMALLALLGGLWGYKSYKRTNSMTQIWR